MKNLTATTLASALLLSTISPILSASTNGIYAGFGVGGSSTNDFNDVYTVTNSGLAGKIFGGYRFKNYMGIEVGYAKLNNGSFFLLDTSFALS